MFVHNPVGIHFAQSQKAAHQGQIQIELGKVWIGLKEMKEINLRIIQIGTVKLGNKERFDKEQIGISDHFM